MARITRDEQRKKDVELAIKKANNSKYIVQQVVLKEAIFGANSCQASLTELQDICNLFAKQGYKVNAMSTTNGGTKTLFGGDLLQATIIFEKEE